MALVLVGAVPVCGGCLAPPRTVEVRVYREDSQQPIQNALVWTSASSRMAWATPIQPPEYEDAYTDAEGKAFVHTYTGSELSRWYCSVTAGAPGFQQNFYEFQGENTHGHGSSYEKGVVHIHLYRTPGSAVAPIKYGERLDGPLVVEKMKAVENPADRPKYDPHIGVDTRTCGPGCECGRDR
ncbi:MAG: hypothetical protein QM783_12750 [Phycisphaerales bacterium]